MRRVRFWRKKLIRLMQRWMTPRLKLNLLTSRRSRWKSLMRTWAKFKVKGQPAPEGQGSLHKSLKRNKPQRNRSYRGKCTDENLILIIQRGGWLTPRSQLTSANQLSTPMVVPIQIQQLVASVTVIICYRTTLMQNVEITLQYSNRFTTKQ